MKKIFFITGEASGDLHAASLLNELYKIIPPAHLTVKAVGSKYLQDAGARVCFDSKYLASTGLTEVIQKVSLYLNLERELLYELNIFYPDVLILVDFPGFNLRLAKKVKRIVPRTKVVYYLPPQVWAWDEGRTKLLARYCDLVLCGLPFEEEFHRKRGVNAFYIGNPVLNELPMLDKKQVRGELGIGEGEVLIGIFPGSRRSEIHYMFPVLLKAVELLSKDFNQVKFIVSQATSLDNISKTKEWKEVSSRLGNRIKLLPTLNQENYKLLCASDIVWLTSGTVTLEAAIYETPMILGYKGNKLNYLLYKMLKKIDMIGLPNIICGGKMVPELIQKEANSENFYNITKKWLHDKNKLDEIKHKLKIVKEFIGDKNASTEAALKIRELMPEYKVVVLK